MGMFFVREKQQVCQLFFIQVVLIVLMGALMTYGPEADANSLKNHGQTGDHGQKHVKKPDTDPLRVYPSLFKRPWFSCVACICAVAYQNPVDALRIEYRKSYQIEFR